MREKLFYTDVTIRLWDTEIQAIIEREDCYYVQLAETAFYPEGGGQPADYGTINELNVLDVQINDGVILHKVSSKPELGLARCSVDWPRRFDHMQHHSGQHLLSAVCRELYGANTVNFHLGTEYVTIDVDVPNLSDTQVSAIEHLTNQYIYDNRSIHTYFISQEQLQELPVVKKPKVTENIRIVEIEGIEYNPCGGTHVSRTGEIGIIKVLKIDKQKANTRLFFKCGYRALKDYSNSLEILATLSTKFNVGRENIIDRVEKLEQKLTILASENERLKEKNTEYVLQSMLSEYKGPFIRQIFEDQSLKELQTLATRISTEADALVLFATTSENKVVLANCGKTSLHCGQFFKQHLAEFKGKCGGNEKAAQAGFPDEVCLQRFYEFASIELQKTED